MIIEERNAQKAFRKTDFIGFANSNELSFELALYSLQWV